MHQSHASDHNKVEEYVVKIVYRFTYSVIFFALFIPLVIFYVNCNDTSNTRGILYDQKDCKLSIWWLTTNHFMKNKLHNNKIYNKYSNFDKNYLSSSYKIFGDNGPFCRTNYAPIKAFKEDNNYLHNWDIIDAVFDDNNINVYIHHHHHNSSSKRHNHSLINMKLECRFYNYRSQFISSTYSLQVLPDIIVRCPLPQYIKQYEKDRLQLKLNFIKNDINLLSMLGSGNSSAAYISSSIFGTCPPIRQVKHKVEYKKNKNQNSMNSNSNSNSVYNISVCSQTKNIIEQNIVEWIEYHQQLGVDHFFLYDTNNNNNNNNILKYYQKKGVVTVIPWAFNTSDSSNSNQQSVGCNDDSCYERNMMVASHELVSCLLRFRSTSKWILALPSTHDFVGLSNKKINNLNSLIDPYTNRPDFIGFEFHRNIYVSCSSSDSSSNTLNYIHFDGYKAVRSNTKHVSYLIRTDLVISIQNEKLVIKSGTGIDAKVTFVFTKMKNGKHIIDETLVRNNRFVPSPNGTAVPVIEYQDSVVKKIEEQSVTTNQKIEYDLLELKEYVGEVMYIPTLPSMSCSLLCGNKCVNRNSFKNNTLLSFVQSIVENKIHV